MSNRITVIRTDTASRISVFPNPVTETLNINLKSDIQKGPKTVKMYNISNVEVFNSIMHSNKAEINVQNFDKGLYFINITDKRGSTEIIKVVVN